MHMVWETLNAMNNTSQTRPDQQCIFPIGYTTKIVLDMPM